MRYLQALIHKEGNLFHWVLVDQEELDEEDCLACGTSPDYDEACRMAKIAWEQHSEGEE